MGKVLFISRSAVDDREDCPRMRLYGHDWGVIEDDDPTGLEPEGASLPLLSGSAIHLAHARLIAGEELETVVKDVIDAYVAELQLRGLYALQVTKEIVREQAYLLEGMLRLWAAVRLPRILEEYEVLTIEKQFYWTLAPGLVEPIRFDVLLRRKADGLIFILDYKTVGYVSDLFFEQKEHNNQTCLYLQALRETLPEGEQVGGIIYEGLVKGQFKKETTRNVAWSGQKVMQSPYTMAYKLSGEAGSIYQTAYTNRKGWQKVRLMDEMPAKEWVEQWLLSGAENIIEPNELFILVPEISPPLAELAEVKEQVIAEELRWANRLDEWRMLRRQEEVGLMLPGTADRALVTLAPKHRNRCYKFGLDNKCKFLGLCFNQGAQPLEDGYKKRKPHHDTDVEYVA